MYGGHNSFSNSWRGRRRTPEMLKNSLPMSWNSATNYIDQAALPDGKSRPSKLFADIS